MRKKIEEEEEEKKGMERNQQNLTARMMRYPPRRPRIDHPVFVM